MKTVRSILRWTRELFGERSIEAPSLSAELLLAEVLGCQRLDLYLDIDRPLSVAERDRLRGLVKRRARAEPVAYILGYKDFFGLRFEVNPNVLVPRPDSELLVELAKNLPTTPRRILDLGTGSGALAIALAKQLPDAQVLALDISPEALSVAGRNAARHSVADRVQLLEGPWEAAEDHGPFELVVSNPPYIERGEVLGQGVAEFEPALALFSTGAGALDDTRRVLRTAGRVLTPDGSVLVEVGAGRAEAVRAHAAELGFAELQTHKDLAGVPRAVSGMWLEAAELQTIPGFPGRRAEHV